jgi:hypothetical protein
MRQVDQYKRILQEEMPYLRDRYHVAELGVFGSFVRGENEENSDLDILVKFNEYPSAFEYIDLEDYLSKRLGVQVDLANKETLKKYIGKRILAEVEYL